MLSINQLSKILLEMDEFQSQSQILEGDGYDAVIDLLSNLRGVEFPAAVLESRSSGVINLIEGPVDSYSQSVWIMGQLGRDESEAELYAAMFTLAKKVIGKFLDHITSDSGLEEWDFSRISYMKRYGGQNARGYEILLNFKENIPLR